MVRGAIFLTAHNSIPYVVITVPAKGAITRLRVLPQDGGAPLGYDLRATANKVADLPAPIAHPEDGATAREIVPAELNTNYPYQEFVATVEKFEYSTAALLGDTPPDGGRFLICTLLVKNMSPRDALLRFDTFIPRCTTEEGEEMPFGGNLLLATTNRKMEQTVSPDKELRVRMYFSIPQGAQPKTLILKQGEGRAYKFTVGGGRELEVPRVTLPRG